MQEIIWQGADNIADAPAQHTGVKAIPCTIKGMLHQADMKCA